MFDSLSRRNIQAFDTGTSHERCDTDIFAFRNEYLSYTALVSERCFAYRLNVRYRQRGDYRAVSISFVVGSGTECEFRNGFYRRKIYRSKVGSCYKCAVAYRLNFICARISAADFGNSGVSECLSADSLYLIKEYGTKRSTISESLYGNFGDSSGECNGSKFGASAECLNSNRRQISRKSYFLDSAVYECCCADRGYSAVAVEINRYKVLAVSKSNIGDFGNSRRKNNRFKVGAVQECSYAYLLNCFGDNYIYGYVLAFFTLNAVSVCKRIIAYFFYAVKQSSGIGSTVGRYGYDSLSVLCKYCSAFRHKLLVTGFYDIFGNVIAHYKRSALKSDTVYGFEVTIFCNRNFCQIFARKERITFKLFESGGQSDFFNCATSECVATNSLTGAVEGYLKISFHLRNRSKNGLDELVLNRRNAYLHEGIIADRSNRTLKLDISEHYAT